MSDIKTHEKEIDELIKLPNTIELRIKLGHVIGHLEFNHTDVEKESLIAKIYSFRDGNETTKR